MKNPKPNKGSKKNFIIEKTEIPVSPKEFYFPCLAHRKPFSSFSIQALVIVFIGFVFYFNSLSNGYVLDDEIIIFKNDYVLEGFHGIAKILSTDAYDSFYKQMGATQQLSGGRYRPLSIVSFAIEQHFFGDNSFLSFALFVQ